MLFPDIKCVIQHWVHIGAPEPVLGRETPSQVGVRTGGSIESASERYTRIVNLNAYGRRHSIESLLHSTILPALRGERAMEAHFLLLASAFLHEEPLVVARVLQHLHFGAPAYRTAATYAGVYFMHVKEVACVITERTILGEDSSTAASKLVLQIHRDTTGGGRCRLCNAAGKPLSQHLDWRPARVVEKKEMKELP